MKRIIPATIILVSLAVMAFWKLNPCSANKVFYSQEERSPVFQLRWQVRDPGCSLDWHPQVVFESAPAGSHEWREIFTGSTDEPHATPGTDRLRFFGERGGYVSWDNQFAVTIDGGKSWSVWDARRDYLGRKANSMFIHETYVEPSGNGRMRLYIYYDNGTESRQLHTSDYGRSWQTD
jgi:hypothetical protein